jgi:AraC family transcriptional regulator, transcriptional activator FtrA
LLALVAYDGLRTFEYSIAADLFGVDRRHLGVDWYRTIVVSADRGRLRGVGGVEVRADAPFEAIARARTIVVPGWRAAARRGATLLSLCSGAFVLGRAGLLDGKRATTHWLFADEFRRAFPHTHYESDALYVDEGPVITSAGSAAGLDACLHLVRRDFGAAVANTVARRMVVAPHREGGQAQYVEAPVAARTARGVGTAMDWALAHLHQAITIEALASRCAMSARTFLRHFGDAAGMTPHAWLQQQRIARARRLLETQPTLTLDDVAAQSGYPSMETFRAAFRRVAGVPPAAYRARFAGAAPVHGAKLP